MARHYSIVTALPLSFFSPSLYRDVAQQWKGFGMAYLLLLVFLSALPYTYVWQQKLNKLLNITIPAFTVQIPDAVLINGSLHTQKKQPFYIRDPKTREVWAVIDTNGHYQQVDKLLPVTLFFIEKSLLHNQISLNQSISATVYPYPELNEPMYINQKTIASALKSINKYILPGCFGLAFLMSVLLQASQFLICFVIGLVISSIKKILLAPSAVLRLAAVAITPVVFLSTGLDLLAINFSYELLLKFTVALGYSYIAIKANIPVAGEGKET